MTNCDWIVCEHSGRWASALRRAIGTETAPPVDQRQVREVRSLEELTVRLGERPRAVALVEVRRTNLAEALTWLADASSLYPRACCVALLDSSAFDDDVRTAVAEALSAAGAVEITDSPRHLQHVLAVGRRHAVSPVRVATGPDEHQSFAEWAWALLPWQRP
jgi:hypothetical protein